MPIEKLRETGQYQHLYRDTDTGIAWIADGSAGVRYTAHPSIDASGSVRGMKDKGYWGRSDRTVKSDGFIYNIDILLVSDDRERIVADECRCGGNH